MREKIIVYTTQPFSKEKVEKWLAGPQYVNKATGYTTTKVLGKIVYYHRLVVERQLGRWLTPDEVVSHKDKKPDNNSAENLEVRGRREIRQANWAKRVAASSKEEAWKQTKKGSKDGSKRL